MGWGQAAMESHRLRLEQTGLLERLKLRQGQEALVWATTAGARAAGISLPGLRRVPAPTTWEHHLAVSWAAAFFTVRGRPLLGGRELLADERWSQEISWAEHSGYRRSGHRPDLITHGPAAERRAVEVELTVKSRTRVRAILDAHADSRAVDEVLYVVADEPLARHIRRCQAHSRLQDKRLIVVALQQVREQALGAPRQQFSPPPPVAYEIRLTAAELAEHERVQRHIAAVRHERQHAEQRRQEGQEHRVIQLPGPAGVQAQTVDELLDQLNPAGDPQLHRRR